MSGCGDAARKRVTILFHCAGDANGVSLVEKWKAA
jgi:hypothetical protein